MRDLVAAALVLALAGCGDGGPETKHGETQPAAAMPNPYQQRLLSLDEQARGLALRRAIQDDGGSCPRIGNSAYQQEHLKMAMWTVRCSSKADWAVYVGASGTVQARKCTEAKSLGLPECRLEALAR